VRENWKAVAGFEGRYEVSDQGRVRSLDHRVRLVAHGVETSRRSPGKILRPGPRKSGHLTVAIGKGNSRGVHQLVMEAFVGPCPDGMEIAHNDGDPTNNWIGNLRYDTKSNNNRDRIHHGATQLSPADVDRIRREAPGALYGGKKRLADELGVNACTISDVLAGRRHAHV
jgi:hypothetical protein